MLKDTLSAVFILAMIFTIGLIVLISLMDYSIWLVIGEVFGIAFISDTLRYCIYKHDLKEDRQNV